MLSEPNRQTERRRGTTIKYLLQRSPQHPQLMDSENIGSIALALKFREATWVHRPGTFSMLLLLLYTCGSFSKYRSATFFLPDILHCHSTLDCRNMFFLNNLLSCS